jgi:hypothetical protein
MLQVMPRNGPSLSRGARLAPYENRCQTSISFVRVGALFTKPALRGGASGSSYLKNIDTSHGPRHRADSTDRFVLSPGPYSSAGRSVRARSYTIGSTTSLGWFHRVNCPRGTNHSVSSRRIVTPAASVSTMTACSAPVSVS